MHVLLPKSAAIIVFWIIVCECIAWCHLSADISDVHLVSTGGDKMVGLWNVDRRYGRKLWTRDSSRRIVVMEPYATRVRQRAVGSKLEHESSVAKAGQTLTTSPDTSCTTSSPWSSTCWLSRQVGTSLTLAVEVNDPEQNQILTYHVRWFQRFKLDGEPNVLSTEIVPGVLPPNLAVSSDGKELRLRPVQSYDMDENSFRAVVSRSLYPGSLAEFVGNITFRILEIPIDMGIKNVGEEIRISIQDHLTLPASPDPKRVKFRWRSEPLPGHYGPLASNMQPSDNGRTLSVQGLRTDQAGVVSCSVYDDAGVFFAKKRFLISVTEGSLDSGTPVIFDEDFKKLHPGNRTS